MRKVWTRPRPWDVASLVSRRLSALRPFLPGVVVAAAVQDVRTAGRQAPQLAHQVELGREGEQLVVEQVAGDQHRVELLAERKVDGVRQGLAGRLAQALARARGAAEVRLEVQVGEV